MTKTQIKEQIKEQIKDLTADLFKEKAFAGEFNQWNTSELIFAANHFKLDFYDTIQILMLQTKK